MLGFLAWLILLTLIVAAAPAVGVLLGVGLSAAFLSVGEKLSAVCGRVGCMGSSTPEAPAFDVEFATAEEVEPSAPAPIQWKWPGPTVNLPGILLRERQRLFRIDCIDERTGLRRCYAVAAKHAGAAEMKAHLWGERTKGIQLIPTDH